MEKYEASHAEKYYDINFPQQIAMVPQNSPSPGSLFGLPELPIFRSMPA